MKITTECVKNILHEDLHMKKLCKESVQHFLTFEINYNMSKIQSVICRYSAYSKCVSALIFSSGWNIGHIWVQQTVSRGMETWRNLLKATMAKDARNQLKTVFPIIGHVELHRLPWKRRNRHKRLLCNITRSFKRRNQEKINATDSKKMHFRQNNASSHISMKEVAKLKD